MPQYESQFEENLYQLRREKLAQIAAIVQSQNPDVRDLEAKYPNSFAFTNTIPELRALGEHKSTEELEAERIEASVAGRIMATRVQGKAGFATLQQGGERLQIYVRKDDVGEPAFELYKLLDLGDHIGVTGALMRTRTGELTLKVRTLTFLTKAMLALPDKYHGLEDVELRYRQRYVDLIMNSGTRAQQEQVAATPSFGGEGGFSPPSRIVPEGALAPGSSTVTDAAAPNEEHHDAPQNVREVFVKRAAILRAIRKFFDERGYLEVETPMLHTVAGGAAARPFTTHHNALDVPLSLRIAPELYLKRLVVGGLDRVYEINRNFRNEGVSTRHNPEFTMLEFYQAYANYENLMTLTEELIISVAMEVNGTTLVHFTPAKSLYFHDPAQIDLAKWQRFTMLEAVTKFWPKEGVDSPTTEDFATLESFSVFLANRIGPMSYSVQGLQESPYKSQCWRTWIGLRDAHDQMLAAYALLASSPPEAHGTIRATALGKAIAAVFEAVAEHELIQPTIIYDFPLAVSPLSKVKPDEPDWVERFEFYIGGFEVGNAFSELNDPDDQRRRFEAQVADKDPEAMAEVDEDYVRALGYGLPPTAGEGVGIDRLTMLLTGSRSIRDVILFPLMRPQAKASGAGDADSHRKEQQKS